MKRKFAAFPLAAFPLAALLLTACCLGVHQASAALDGCIGHWTFDEGSGLTANDSSGQSNHGTLEGGAQWVTSAWRGRAIAFDGSNDRVRIANPAGIPIGNAPRTFAAWVKWRGLELPQPGGGAYQAMFGYGTTAGATLFTVERSGGGNPGRLFWMTSAIGITGTTPAAFPPGQWVHVAASHDGLTTRIYRNGQIEGELNTNLTTTLTALGLEIGGAPPITSDHHGFAGDMDEVQLYNRALSPAEIVILMTEPAIPAIRSAGTAAFGLQQAGTYQIEASGQPQSYGATGLPDGLSLDPLTGLISGTPVVEGTTMVTLTATNGAGTGTAPLEIRVSKLLPGYAIADSVGYWSFDEGHGNIAHDSSGTGNHGTLSGGTRWTSDAWRGRALAFDGIDDQVAIPNPLSLPLGNSPRTVSLWAKWGGTEFPGPRYQGLIGYGQAYVNHGLFAIERGGISAWKRLFWFDWSVSSVTGGTPDAFPASQWVHIAATYDGDTVRLYRNGTAEGSVTTAVNTVAGLQGLLIGNVPDNDGNHGRFQGVIDEVMIFHRVLTEQELSTLRSPPSAPAIRGEPVSETGLGASFSYQILADGSPATFSATGLPNGLTLDPQTGLISGTPTEGGTFLVTLQATNASGSATSSLKIIVRQPMPVFQFPDCVGYWPFDDAAGTVARDISGLDNHGNIRGNAAWTGGRRGGALFFDGVDDDVQILSPAHLPLGASPRTIAMWVNWAGQEFVVPGGFRYQALLGYGKAFVTKGLFSFERGGADSTGRLFWFDWSSAFLAGSSAPALDASTWVHVALTYDGQTLRLYRNGQPDGTLAVTTNTVENHAVGLLLGSTPENDGWHGRFCGALDEVCLFERALTESEIQQLADPPPVGMPELRIRISATQTHVTWHSLFHEWTLEKSDTLAPGSWQTVDPPYLILDGKVHHITQRKPSHEFFRLRAP